MRLIDTKTLRLENFGRFNPPYVILSHRWVDEEVVFQEIQDLEDKTRTKSGFRKIHNFCQLARSYGYDYAWIDTCCINKADPEELTEAINSMFRWYQDSSLCIAYLSDVFSRQPPELHNSQFESSQWFTRGWTLQELLAPAQVELYTAEWIHLSSRSSCSTAISEITGINEPALETSDLRGFSIAQIMSWAAKRETTRVEDMAYCLLGIFDVNMPLLYGEGNNAFIRLQREIISHSDDQSILAWTASEQSQIRSALAPMLSCFSPASGIQRATLVGGVNHFPFERKPFAMTNMGIHITLPIIRSPSSKFWAVLDCHEEGIPLCIPLQPSDVDGNRYHRASGSNRKIHELEGLLCQVRDVYIQGPAPLPESFHTPSASPKKIRWSTEALEKGRIVGFVKGSESSRTSDASIYDSLEVEIVSYVAFMFLTLAISFLFPHQEFFACLAFFNFIALLGNLFLKGSLGLHVRLLTLAGLSSAGLHLEAVLNQVRDLWSQNRSGNAPPTLSSMLMPGASSVRSYDIHGHDDLLRAHWQEDAPVLGVLILIALIIAGGPQFMQVSWVWYVRFAIGMCMSVPIVCLAVLLAYLYWMEGGRLKAIWAGLSGVLFIASVFIGLSYF